MNHNSVALIVTACDDIITFLYRHVRRNKKTSGAAFMLEAVIGELS